MRMAWVIVALLGGCGTVVSDELYFTNDDRALLCAESLDDYLVPVNWDVLQDRIDVAVREQWVLNVYAHAPGVTIADDTLDRALTMFEAAGLAFSTYHLLDPSAPPRAGVVLSFDDDDAAAWTSIQPLLARHHAIATFFVSGYDGWSADDRARLHALADDGHAVEAHTLHHLRADCYPEGPEAYVRDEVLPSLDALRSDGFAAESFAYPGGDRNDASDAAIAPHVRYLRGTARSCTYATAAPRVEE